VPVDAEALANSWFVREIGSIEQGEVKKKHHSSGWSFSCFSAHLFEQELF